MSSVLGFYGRRLAGADAKGSGQSGAVLVVQRSSSDLKLNPHVHALFLDGVYRPPHGDAPVFCALPRLSTSGVADVLQTVRVPILGNLVRQGVVEAGPEASWIDADLAPRDPVLAQLAAAAVSGLPPAGPELRQRPPIPLRGRPGLIITAPLASPRRASRSTPRPTPAPTTFVAARSWSSISCARRSLADEHLRLLPDDLVRIQLKRPFRDGRIIVTMKEVDPRLQEVFAPIARDLNRAGLRAKLRTESGIATTYSWTAVVYVNGQRLGIVETTPEPPTESQVECLAEQVQNYILEFVKHGPEAVVWPRCQHTHKHPMVIEHSPDWPPRWPCWVCPVDPNFRMPVGEHSS